MSPIEPSARGIVMEFKRLKEGEEMERELSTALNRIEEKEYPAAPRAEGCGEVPELGIVNYAKSKARFLHHIMLSTQVLLWAVSCAILWALFRSFGKIPNKPAPAQGTPRLDPGAKR
uniref:Uncharacterized protein n=1 Tax=Candidatus Kentrum sp. TC TaxID=2126339 RepID=A0A450Z0J6_9GAMM|nr:MAG: hypothetical protein BECKTC1821D_GA0114238_10452 [Candidatus Kentron sp. TC]VFK57075.1 MAG: hypothetical protein BECKTC1821F_GA0114240_101436 [Candidatus Kentron sp. TC]